MKTGVGPRQSSGLVAVSPPYARANGIRFSGSRALQHRLSVMRLPGDRLEIAEVEQSVQQIANQRALVSCYVRSRRLMELIQPAMNHEACVARDAGSRSQQNGLKHIFHFNLLADLGSINGKSGSFELWRSSADSGVARKTEAFFGNEDSHVHFSIAIFVVDHGYCISALRNTAEGNLRRIARRYGSAVAFRIFAAVREKARICGNADQNIALLAAQARNIDLQRCCRSSSCRRTNEGGGSNRRAQDPCRTFCPKT